MEKSFCIKELIVAAACIALTVLVLGLFVPMLLSYFNECSARNDARIVCEKCVTDENRSAYPNIIIAVKTAGRFYLFGYDTAHDTLYEYADNPTSLTGDDILSGIPDFCEEGKAEISEISEKMSKAPLNVRCFTGGRLKGGG